MVAIPTIKKTTVVKAPAATTVKPTTLIGNPNANNTPTNAIGTPNASVTPTPFAGAPPVKAPPVGTGMSAVAQMVKSFGQTPVQAPPVTTPFVNPSTGVVANNGTGTTPTTGSAGTSLFGVTGTSTTPVPGTSQNTAVTETGAANNGMTGTTTTSTGGYIAPAGQGPSVQNINGQTYISYPDGRRELVDTPEETTIAQTLSTSERELADAAAARQTQYDANQAAYKQAQQGLVSAEAVDRQGAQELQNRRGGFYSGGLDYQLGSIGSSYAQQRGQLAQDFQRANQELNAKYGNQTEQIRTTISSLLSSAPQFIQQAIDAKVAQKRQDAIEVGKVTGTILLPEAQEAFNQLLDLKSRAESKTITAQERAVLGQQADALRNKLAGMGVDISKLGAGSNLATSSQQSYGIKTFEQKQEEAQQAKEKRDFEYNKEKDKTNLAYDKSRDKISDGWKLAENTGVISESLANALGDPSLKGKKTVEAKEKVWDHLWTQADKLGVIPDQLADLIGVERGTQTQAAYEFAQNLALDEDAADLNWIQEDRLQDEAANKGSGSQKTVSPSAGAELLSTSLKKPIGEDAKGTVYGTITDPQKRADAFYDVMQTVGAMDPTDVVEMLSKAGYKSGEIAQLKKTYPEFFEAKK